MQKYAFIGVLLYVKNHKREVFYMIKVELKDGSILEVEKGASVLEVAKKISEGLARMATCRRS